MQPRAIRAADQTKNIKTMILLPIILVSLVLGLILTGFTISLYKVLKETISDEK